jgi:hypothetical protein
MTVLDKLESEEDWHNARRKVLYQEVVCLIKRCSVDLLSFEDVRSDLHLRQRFDRGLQEIPVDKIQGSVGRFDDFTSAFLPRKDHLRERWQGVDQVMKQGKTPPIEVYQVDDIYFVVDGNHRVSVARQHGYETLEAYVTEFQTPFKPSGEAEVEEMLIQSEQAAFQEKAGAANAEVADSMIFTCSGCYQDITQQVEVYRREKEFLKGEPYSFEQAFPDWCDEVYLPSIAAIRDHNLVSRFPERTEADLFIWAWQNNRVIEDLELDDSEGPPAE